jgi:hypothetical protein
MQLPFSVFPHFSLSRTVSIHILVCFLLSMQQHTASTLPMSMLQAAAAAAAPQAVEIFEHDLLWDGSLIRLSNKGHLRLATYMFKYFAHLNIRPVALTISEPSPGGVWVGTGLQESCRELSCKHRCNEVHLALGWLGCWPFKYL